MTDRTMWILAAIWMTFLAVLMLTGCRTKTVTEYVAVHDTLRINTTDTLIRVKTEYSHDTLRIEVEKTVTVNEGGDTIKLEIYKDRWRDRVIHSTDTVREKSTDTIYISKDTEHDKETVIKRKSILKPALVVAFLTLMTALCVIIYRRKR